MRFGANKLLFPIAGKPMYRHGLDLLLSILEKKQNYELIAATQYPEIYQDLMALRENQERLYPLLTKESRLGMSYTIREAIHYGQSLDLARKKTTEPTGHSCTQSDGCIWNGGANYDTFMVADQPYMSEKSLLAFMEAVMASGKSVGCVTEHGEFQNPVMFRETLEPELLTLTGDQGGKRIFKNHLDDCCTYPLENQCRDIDCTEDL